MFHLVIDGLDGLDGSIWSRWLVYVHWQTGDKHTVHNASKCTKGKRVLQGG